MAIDQKIPEPHQCLWTVLVYEKTETGRTKFYHKRTFETLNEARYYVQQGLPDGCFGRIAESGDSWMLRYQKEKEDEQKEIQDGNF